MATTWQRQGNAMAGAGGQERGNYMAAAARPDGVATARREQGKSMAATWRQHGESKARAWQQHGGQQHGNNNISAKQDDSGSDAEIVGSQGVAGWGVGGGFPFPVAVAKRRRRHGRAAAREEHPGGGFADLGFP